MKIAYYIDTIIPTQRANMVHVMKMCQAFSDLGHTVTLFCDSSQRNPDLTLIRSRYAVSDQFAIQTAYIPKLLRKYGHRLAAYYGAYKKTYASPNCDLAYSRSAASLFFLRNRVPYIYEAHMEPDWLNKRIESKVLKHKNFSKLVVISEALKNRYLEIYPFLRKGDIQVLHDGADPAIPDFDDKATLMASEEEIKIGYIGHLYPGKCMETLLPLAKNLPQYRFHVVGGTDEWVKYWKSKTETQLVNNLIFYGFINNCEIGHYYRAFDIVVLPFSKDISIGRNKRSNIGKWISPLKLFEAMAYGKPILVSRLATIEEVMEDEKDCIMAEADNIEDWAEKLVKLCEDPEMQKKLGTAAQEKLIREYTWLERAKRAAQLFE